MPEQRWIYDVLDEPLERIRDILDQRGRHGWEAFGVLSKTVGSNVVIFLKKRAGEHEPGQLESQTEQTQTVRSKP